MITLQKSLSSFSIHFSIQYFFPFVLCSGGYLFSFLKIGMQSIRDDFRVYIDFVCFEFVGTRNVYIIPIFCVLSLHKTSQFYDINAVWWIFWWAIKKFHLFGRKVTALNTENLLNEEKKINTNSVQTCVIWGSKLTEKKTWHTQFQFPFVSFFLSHLIFSYLVCACSICKACNKFGEYHRTLYAKAECAQKQFHWIYVSVYQRMTKKKPGTLNTVNWHRREITWRKAKESEWRKKQTHTHSHEQWNQNSQLVTVVSRDTYSKTHRRTMHENETSLFSITLS